MSIMSCHVMSCSYIYMVCHALPCHAMFMFMFMQYRVLLNTIIATAYSNIPNLILSARCWINGSLWIYKGPILAILVVCDVNNLLIPGHTSKVITLGPYIGGGGLLMEFLWFLLMLSFVDSKALRPSEIPLSLLHKLTFKRILATHLRVSVYFFFAGKFGAVCHSSSRDLWKTSHQIRQGPRGSHQVRI